MRKRMSRAMALPYRPLTTREILWTLAHATFVCALLALLLLLVGCDPSDGPTSNVDYGPVIDEKSVLRAVSNTFRDTDPLATQVGAFVHFQTSDNIAAGTMNIVSSDTGQTVVERAENDQTVTFSIYEQKVTYHPDTNTPEQMSREFELPFLKPTPTPAPTPAPSDAAATPTPAPNPTPSLTSNSQISAEIASTRLLDAVRAWTNAKLHTTDDTPVKTTYHRLKTWEDQGPAPALVQARPNCLGLPSCQMTFRHVSFDLVQWDTPEGTRTRLDFTVSPQLPQTSGFNMTPIFPYIPGLMKACVTQLVAIGDGRNRTLITECEEVVDFQYTAPAGSTPTPSPSPVASPTPTPTPSAAPAPSPAPTP